MSGDSNALALGLRVDTPGAGGFSWYAYPNLAARYDFTDLSTMYTSTGAYFDGSNYLINSVANFRSADSSGSVTLWFKTSSADNQTLFSSNDEGGINNFVYIFVNAGVVGIGVNVAGTASGVSTAASTFADGAWHFVEIRSSGTAYSIRIDGSAQTLADADGDFGPGSNNGNWFADVSARDNINVGASVYSSTNYYLIGSLDTVMVWSSPLTNDESDYVYNSGSGKSYDQIVADDAASVTNCPDSTTIVASYSLDEFSGVRMDASSSDLHFTSTGDAVAASFASASSQYLSTATAAVSDFDFTIACWVKTGTTAEQTAVWIGDKDADDVYYRIGIDGSGNAMISRQASGGGEDQTTGANIDDDAWHFMCAMFDAANDVDLYVDAVSVVNDTTSVAFGAFDTTAVGAHAGSTPGAYFDGEIDSVMIWASLLTAANKTWLYNAGSGRSLYELKYSNDADNPGLPANYYTFSRYVNGSTATDQVGSLDLSDTNTVTRVPGNITELPLPVAGNVQEQAEAEDRGLEFDGADQYAVTNTAAISAVGTTIAAWVKSTTTTEQTAFWIGDKDADDVFVRIGIDGSGNAFLGRNASGGGEDQTSDANIDDGEWHLIVAVLTGTADVDLYVDDGSAANDTTSVALTGFDRTAIGAHAGSTPATYFDGMIDEVMVFDSLLDATDISDLYNSGVGVLARDLVDGTVTLSGTGAIPIHAWSLSKNNSGGAGEDIGSTGGIDLTLTNAPVDADGIAAGASLIGLVSLVEDQTSNGNDLSQATLASRPEIVRVSDGSGYALDFDGVDDYMVTSAFGSALSQPNTIVATVQSDDVSGTVIDGIVGTSEQRIGQQSGFVRLDGGTPFDTSISFDQDTLLTVVGIFNGASSVVYVNGGTAETGNTGSETMTGATVGYLYNFAALPWNGTMRQIVVNDGTLSSVELNKIGKHLADTHGLTWTTIA